MKAVGELKVRLVRAKLRYNTDIIGKMDPYIKLQLGSQKYKTDVAYSEGKDPQWTNIFEFNVNGEEQIDITIMDKDVIYDDFVAEGSIPLGSVFTKLIEDKWVPVKRKGSHAGEVLVHLEYKPKSAPSNQHCTNQSIDNFGKEVGENFTNLFNKRVDVYNNPQNFGAIFNPTLLNNLQKPNPNFVHLQSGQGLPLNPQSSQDIPLTYPVVGIDQPMLVRSPNYNIYPDCNGNGLPADFSYNQNSRLFSNEPSLIDRNFFSLPNKVSNTNIPNTIIANYQQPDLNLNQVFQDFPATHQDVPYA